MFNFQIYVCLKQWLTWVTCRVSQNNLLRYSIFEIMYVVNSGWLGWLARIRFSQLQFFKLYPSQTLFKWLTFHSLVYIFSRDSIQNMYVAIVGWLGWLAIPRKIISLDVQFFENMCIVNSGWLGWLVESRKTIRRDIRFLKLCMS
jgi:hypothetical protein